MCLFASYRDATRFFFKYGKDISKNRKKSFSSSSDASGVCFSVRQVRTHAEFLSEGCLSESSLSKILDLCILKKRGNTMKYFAFSQGKDFGVEISSGSPGQDNTLLSK